MVKINRFFLNNFQKKTKTVLILTDTVPKPLHVVSFVMQLNCCGQVVKKLNLIAEFHYLGKFTQYQLLTSQAVAIMAPKTKGKKAKGESEEERLAREEEEKRVKDAEAKRVADEAEKLRVENLRVRTERRAFRSVELASLGAENVKLLEKLAEIESKMTAEIAHEVATISISHLS